MNAIQKALVQESWKRVEPVADAVATLFYGRLFALDPSLRALFPAGSLAEQERKLMQTLAVAVRGLDGLDELVPALEALGRRHAGYGVEDSHYAVVGEALLWTLERGLGEAFTPEVRDAWAGTYALVSGVMRGATGRQRAA